MSEALPVQNGLKQGHALSLMAFNFALEHAIREVPKIKNGTHQPLVYADDFNILRQNINSIKKTEALLEACRKIGLEVNAEKAMHIVYVLPPICRVKSQFTNC